MGIKKLVVGSLGTNCYLVWDENLNSLIIDPGDAGDFIIQKVTEFKLKPRFIIATHGHFDHVLAAQELKLTFSIPFLIHRADLFLLKRTQGSIRYFLGFNTGLPPKPDGFVKDGDKIKFGGENLQIIETPGHTPGSICLYGSGVLFSGDSLFADGFGRTDFSYSSREDMKNSLAGLLKLPSQTIIYPGHGESTTISDAQNNL